MNAKHLFLASVLTLCPFERASAHETKMQYVQLAEIVIDPQEIEDYKAAVREQIETAIRVEPGVLVLYAVAD